VIEFKLFDYAFIVVIDMSNKIIEKNNTERYVLKHKMFGS